MWCIFCGKVNWYTYKLRKLILELEKNMNFVNKKVALFLISMMHPCILLPLSKNDISKASSFQQFLADANNRYDNNGSYPTVPAYEKRNLFKEIFYRRNRRSDDHTLISLGHRSLERQAIEQFSQKNLVNNQHDDSNLRRLLWHQFHGQNFQSQWSPSASKPSPLNSLSVSHTNTLPSQETAQLDPIYIVNKQTTEATSTQPFDNVFIDLLHNQQSITESNTNRFESLSKFSSPLFNSYLAGFASSIKGIVSEKNCSMIVKTLPILLTNSFINTITTISKLQMANNFMIPFVILSVINFITSFLFLNEYCPGSS